MQDMDKMEYEAPTLAVHGSIEDLTHGNSTGNFLDADFPVGTAFGDLTFS